MKTRMYCKPSKSAVHRALQQVRTLCERTPPKHAEDRMRLAKEQFTKASVAVLKDEPGAGEQAERALQAVETARRELAAVNVIEAGK